jgi:hypothetical protein
VSGAGSLFFPLDDEVMVGGLPISPEAGRAAVGEAGERPYEQAMTHLWRHHGIRLSKQFLEKLTQRVGEFWLHRDDQETTKSLTEKIVPLAEADCDCCCVFADGTMVHTDGDWHEVRVGTVRSVRGEITLKSSIARFVDVERFGADLWRKACEYGYRTAALKAFLGDGSHWIWSLADMHFPDAWKILDWYHLAENISKCANELFGEGTQESRGWAKRMRRIMKKGRVRQALRNLEKIRVRSQRKRQAKHELVTYLMNNRERVDYPRYRSLGLPIGSGEVEAQCKVLVQARCKQSGMRWTKDGAEQALRVRCALRDGTFDTLWDHPRESMTVWHKRHVREERKRAA